MALEPVLVYVHFDYRQTTEPFQHFAPKPFRYFAQRTFRYFAQRPFRYFARGGVYEAYLDFLLLLKYRCLEKMCK